MPSTIPYDPSLVLASVVNEKAVKTVKAISDKQKLIDAAQDHMNALLSTRRSLDMTKSELLNMNIDVADLEAEVEKLDTDLKAAAKTYVDTKIQMEKELVKDRAGLSGVRADVESPIDYVKTQIKTMPLAADSINMDVQYFSQDMNKEGSSSHSDQITSFIASQGSWLGKSASTELTNAVSKQVNEQVKRHSISGTLVISVSCTHKNANIMAPLVIDVDKGIKVWNSIYGDSEFLSANKEDMAKLCAERGKEKKENETHFSIISGTTFGSSFVGMVHILNTSDTNVNETMSSMATSMQAQMDAAAWFASASGGFGASASIANDVKNLLSTQNISSHVTMICMGTIPSMVAHEVQLGVEKFATFDPKANLEALATFQNATNANQGSVQQSAAAARTGGQMIAMKQGDVKAALSALADIDDGSNKILDINSMMTALEDYLKKAANGTSGVPINYYLHDVTKDMLVDLWVAKYYPRKEEVPPAAPKEEAPKE
ncbi:unnamed protein product [Clonostachys rosea f. rosea IK726]|uniref:Uncharacterized protein n=2 Tax=Bionectria ochroleuca TaxID=29856 RepID=A0A0B7KAD9_BIOOC|nr:unnamed protein product [Clonostachys rosea f. rosea IK726]